MQTGFPCVTITDQGSTFSLPRLFENECGSGWDRRDGRRDGPRPVGFECNKNCCGLRQNNRSCRNFYKESKDAGKASENVPTSLRDSVTKDTHVTVISLVNEAQCEQVCFGGEENLLELMPTGSCVVLTSTVTGALGGKVPRLDRFRHSPALSHWYSSHMGKKGR